ncbi:hypothetical protein JOQ06_011211, partial [Pogonophryne albipinna]
SDDFVYFPTTWNLSNFLKDGLTREPLYVLFTVSRATPVCPYRVNLSKMVRFTIEAHIVTAYL